MAVNAFRRMDTDGSGFVDMHKIEVALREAGIQYERHVLEKMVAGVDLSYDGTIEYPEFVKLLAGRCVCVWACMYGSMD